MFSTTQKSFILVINQEIDAVANDWNNMRDYCSETGKRGQVYVVETNIPFGGNVVDIVTTKKYFGEIN